MTAAYRLRGVGWFGSCVAVVLGFYLVSLQVAAERKRLDDVNTKIQSAERDIRALETEFDTRANLAQLEKWNGDTLALAAPTAGQFVPSEAALAAIDVTRLPGDADVQTAALVVPSLPDATPVEAAVPVPVPVPVVATAAGTISAGPIAAAAVAPSRAAAIVRTAAAAPAATPSGPMVRVGHAKPEAVAMLDRKLLSDRTLGDLLSGARSEGGRVR